MRLTAVCLNGHSFEIPPLVSFERVQPEHFVQEGNLTSCPFCGAYARITDVHRRRLGNEIWTTIREPGVSRSQIYEFREIAEKIRRGEASVEAGISEISEVNKSFAKILEVAGNNGPLLSLLIAILALVLQIYSTIDSNKSSAQAHADALDIKNAINHQTEIIQSASDSDVALAEAQAMLAEKIEEFAKVSQEIEDGRKIAKPQRSTNLVYQNRAQRRKANAVKRKSGGKGD